MTPKAILFNRETRLLRSGWRILALILWVMPLVAGISYLSGKVVPRLPASLFLPGKAILGLGLIAGCLALHHLFAKVVEHRIPVELQVDRHTHRYAGLGFLLGGGAMLLITAILALSGSYQVLGHESAVRLLRALFFYLPQSFMEDFIFCLIVYRLLREGAGRRIALLVAPLLFGAAHLGNPNESFLGITEIFTGGMLMYYLFERTGSFWSVWALHFSWNFTMNGVLGLANSGQAIPGYLTAKVTGPAWLTGGPTGPEASVLAVGLDLLLLTLLVLSPDRLLRPGQAVAPAGPHSDPLPLPRLG